MNFSTRCLSIAFLTLAALVGLLASACGSGGDLGTFAPNPLPVQSGNVTLTIKDAPLSDLASFTIDISSAVLKGAGNADAPIFPGPNAPTNPSVTIDLLSAQAFGVLLSSATVPVGNYYSVELTYSNPQAVTTSNVSQTIQRSGNTLLGLFSPTLHVSNGSTQAIQVDVDLQNSVVDLGPTSLFLAPVVVVDVLNQATAIQQVRGLVTSITTTSDSFAADILFYGANAPRGGSVNVQCSTSTTFKDGTGAVSTGNVTTQLVMGDLVSIDGTLLHNTITATSVQRLPNTQPGVGSQNGFNFTGGLPPFTDITGTITAVNTTASTLTLRVQRAYGPGTPPVPGSSAVINVASNTTMSRGNLTQTLGDFVPGNMCSCYANAVAAGWEAIDLSESPAYLTGTVVSLTPSATTGLDLLTFTPVSVEQIPVAQLPFVPSTMTADIPTGSGLATNNSVGLVGFFDGTSHFDAFGRSSFPGGGNSGGGLPGLPNPTPLPPVGNVFDGTLAASSTSSITNNGIEFSLDILRKGTAGPATLNVTVSTTARMQVIGVNGGVVTLTPAQAVTEINNAGNNSLIEVEGSSAPTGSSFVADISLLILKGNVTLPGPGPSPLPNVYYQSGNVTANTTATAANGTVNFSLDSSNIQIQPFPLPNLPQTTVLSVTVTSAASITMWTGQNAPQTLTAAQAATELTAAAGIQNIYIEASGSNAASNGTFTADLSLTIWVSPPQTYFVTGVIPSNGTITESSGVVVFQLATYRFGTTLGSPNGGTTTTTTVIVTVTVPANSPITLYSALGAPSILTASQAVAQLTSARGNNGYNVQAEGTADVTSSNTFTADIGLSIMLPAQTTPGPIVTPPGNGGGGNSGGGTGGTPTTSISGTIVGSASMSATGVITFTLARGLNIQNVTVTTSANTLFMLISTSGAPGNTLPGVGGPTTGIAMLTATQALNELNGNPLTVEVSGILNSTTNTMAANTVTIIK